MLGKPPVILFRPLDDEGYEELATAEHYLPCHRYLHQVPYNRLVIPRYSALPYYEEVVEGIHHLGGTPINTLYQHRWCARLPEWYEDLQPRFRTPKTWVDYNFHRAPEGEYVVKGFTNSRKLCWDKLMYAPNKRAAANIACDLMGDGYIGPQGIVYREYIPLKPFGGLNVGGCPISHEWRFFFYQNKELCSGFYWDVVDPDEYEYPDPPIGVTRFAQQIADYVHKMELAAFFVLDVAIDMNDEPLLVEVNDGMQSGPQGCDDGQLYRNLALYTK